GLERAAVEEDPVGTDEGELRCAGRRPLAEEELRHVPCHFPFGRKRETPFSAGRVGTHAWPRVRGHGGEEAVEHGGLDLPAREGRCERTSDDGPPPPGHRDAHLAERRVPEHALLRRTAGGDE